MIKKDRGISLVSLVITIVVMMIIASITINTSLDRFEINNINKMINDLELLQDKVSNYYLKYNVIPVVRDTNNDIVIYTGNINFDKNPGDNANYYIIDLKAMEGISLNYGQEGFKNLNSSDDVYIINEKSHNIYYARGIQFNDKYYYSLQDGISTTDNVPPSKPEIKIISGEKNEDGIYISDVQIEIIPGKDNWSGVEKTEYSTDNGVIWNNIEDLENNILPLISENGLYIIKAKTTDKNQNTSENTLEITIEI